MTRCAAVQAKHISRGHKRCRASGSIDWLASDECARDPALCQPPAYGEIPGFSTVPSLRASSRPPLLPVSKPCSRVFILSGAGGLRSYIAALCIVRRTPNAAERHCLRAPEPWVPSMQEQPLMECVPARCGIYFENRSFQERTVARFRGGQAAMNKLHKHTVGRDADAAGKPYTLQIPL